MTRILSRPYDQHAADRLALSGFLPPIARALAARCGATALAHPYGCSQLGDDLQHQTRVGGVGKTPERRGRAFAGAWM